MFLIKSNPDSNRYSIIEKASKKEIGHISVYRDSEEHRADTRELGYANNEDYCRKGYMQEAVKAILADLFQSDIKCVWACCIQINTPSKNLIEKMGFKFVKAGVFDAEGNGNEVPSFEYVMSYETFIHLYI